MTRTGKIARIPLALRNELNRRLQEGEPQVALVPWLNEQPGVQRILKEYFGGRAVSEQNLSEWRQGGYEDWLRHEAACALVRDLQERAQELGEAAQGQEMSDRLAVVLAAELARVAEVLLAEATKPEERWERLKEVLGQLHRLRREDHRAARLKMERERREEEREEKRKQETQRSSRAESVGKLMDLIAAVRHDLPLPEGSERATRSEKYDAMKPNPGKSNHLAVGPPKPPSGGATILGTIHE